VKARLLAFVLPSKTRKPKISLTVAMAGVLVLPFAFHAQPAQGATGDISEFSVSTANSGPAGTALGPDGNFWFIEQISNRIGRITPAGAITEFPIPTNSRPWDITAGPDGNLWFTEQYSDQIARITPAGSITEFPIPPDDSKPLGSEPWGITAGPDGNLWFTEQEGNRIGRITPTGTITEFPIPLSMNSPFDITVGPDGNLWFTAMGAIGRVTPAGEITEFSTTGVDSFGIAAGADGNLWFTDIDGGIGRLTPGGAVTRFPVPTTDSRPYSITTGSDGNLWFTEQNGNRIGRITPAGLITEFPIPTAASRPWGITKGANNDLWFTEFDGNRIGRIDAAAPPPAYKCGTYHFFGVRGSGESSDLREFEGMGRPVWSTKVALGSRIPGIESEPVIGTFPNDYPAINVYPFDLSYYTSDYQDSQYKGVVQLQKQLREFFSRCKTTYAIIAGYSQGADVVGDVYGRMFSTLTDAERKRIGAVIMLGDPRFVYNKKLAKMYYGDFDRNLHGSFLFASSTQDRQNPHGIDPKLVGNIYNSCIKSATGVTYDPVCNSNFANLASCAPSPFYNGAPDPVLCAHLQYDFEETDNAALWAAVHLKKLPKLR
jgi:streptogramin lyase